MGQLLFAAMVNFSAAQSVELTTFQNSVLRLVASDLTTNGVVGLTNTAPHLMVEWVSPHSTHQGTVSLVTTQVWARRYDGSTNSSDGAAKVVVDGTQNVIVVGNSYDPSTRSDPVTIKYANDGTPLWTNRYDTSSHADDFASFLAVDSAGNIFLTGHTDVSSSVWDILTVKYSPDGSLLWASRFNRYGTNLHQPAGLAVDVGGNVVVVATTHDDSDRPFTTIKYDPQGIAIWTNYYKGSPTRSDYASGVAIDALGNIFVVGGSDGMGTGFNYTTLKYAPDGTVLWTNRYVGGGLTIPTFLALDRDGNVIVTGDSMLPTHRYVTLKYSNDGVTLWTNLLPAPVYQGGSVPRANVDLAGNVLITGGSPSADGNNADFTTVKYSPTGVSLWTNRFFEVNFDNPAPGGTVVDNAGNLFLAGHSTGPGGTNIDFVTVKYDPNGDAVWTNRYNGLTPDSADHAQDIAVDDAGNVYVTGGSGGFGNGDFATVKYSDFIHYTPPTNFVGSDSFAFVAVDNLGNSATGLVSVVVQPENLQFNTHPTNLHFGGQGMHLQVDGARGTNPVTIYASTNLLQWEAVVTNPPVRGSIQFTDREATNCRARFYRAAQQ